MNSNLFTNLITKAQKAVPRFSVRPHPAGGFAIARQVPGSTFWLYEVTHSSAAVLEKAVAQREAAVISANLHGVRDGHPREEQLGFGFAGRGRFGHAA